MGLKMKDWINSNKRNIIFAVGAVLFAFSWIGFVFTPMTGDIKVFLASANQSHYISEDLIVGAFKAWELKSVFSRTLMYLLYKIACLFTSYGTLSFEILCKALYTVMIAALNLLSIKLLAGKDRKKVVIGTMLTSAAFMAMHTGSQMQVEMTTALLILLAYALYINAIETNKFSAAKLLCSGFLIGSTFFFKSALLLLSVTVVAAVCIYLLNHNKKLSIKRMLTVASGSVICLVATFVLILLINPSEIQDMIDASAFQSTLLSVKIPIKDLAVTFLTRHKEYLVFLPVVAVGVASLLINSVYDLKHRKFLTFLFRITMWLMPAVFVLLSNKYFVYHFAAYIFPSLVDICDLGKKKRLLYKCLLGTSLTLAIAWYTVAFSVVSANFEAYYQCNITAYEKTAAELKTIDFVREENTLYLDAGCGGYCLGNPSHIKYFYPLPLQRLPEDSTLTCHTESLVAAMSFDGKYIAVDKNWFFYSGKYAQLSEKMETQYEYVASYYMFSPPFSYDPNAADINEFKLYEKK